MTALILNSGRGSRMGYLTEEASKCMTSLSDSGTILSRQLRMLAEARITNVVMTTGYCQEKLEAYCQECGFAGQITFVHNPVWQDTNYIYSIYCAQEFLEDDILLMHGDLVFESRVLDELLACPDSCMVVDSTLGLSQKDFKAVLENGYVTAEGVELFQSAAAAMPLYKLNRADWKIWLEEIVTLCDSGKRDCYAENALNNVSNCCLIKPCDIMRYKR